MELATASSITFEGPIRAVGKKVFTFFTPKKGLKKDLREGQNPQWGEGFLTKIVKNCKRERISGGKNVKNAKKRPYLGLQKPLRNLRESPRPNSGGIPTGGKAKTHISRTQALLISAEF